MSTPDSKGDAPSQSDSTNLLLRIAAAVVLAPLALAAAWFGGWFWVILAFAVSCGLYAEWLQVTKTYRASVMVIGTLALFFSAFAMLVARVEIALLALLVATTVNNAILNRDQRWWVAGGLFYAAAAMAGSILLRGDPVQGFAAIAFVFGVVWATDIMGYIAGRTIGGPKLAPTVSPKKTWSGAIGSLAGSIAVAVAFASAGFGATTNGPATATASLVIVALTLSVVSQLGDLFESAVKRHFGVKDSSHIIPGHGGLLDRLDGFVFAVAAAAIVGVLRGGFDHAAAGFLNW